MRAKLLKISLYTVLAVAVLVMFVLWIIGREITLRYAFDRISARTNGMLTATGLHGGLYEGIVFDQLVVKLPTQTITLDDGKILWEPMAFVNKTLLARHARIGKLTVEVTGTSPEPAKAPPDLLLPIELIIPAMRIDRIEYRDRTGAAQKTTAIQLAPLEVSLQHRARRWQIDNLSLATPWGDVSGQLVLAAVQPFAIDGSIAIDQKSGDLRYRVPVKLSGQLGDLNAASAFVVKDMPGNATARIALFGEQLVTHATVAMPHFQPRRWNAEWPEADVAVEAALAPQGKANWQGTARVTNNLAGSLDAGRVPVLSATSRFAGNPQSMQFTDLVVALAGGGTLSGSGTVKHAHPAFVLTARDVNLKALHAKLRATKIAGDIRATQNGAAVEINAALSEAKLSLKADASIDANQAVIRTAQLRAGAGSLNFSGNVGLKASRPFTVAGEATAFNPAEFGSYPPGNLNATLKADGALSPSWRVNADVALKPSQLSGKPLSGTLRASASPDAVNNVDADLTFGTNRVTAKGGMSASKSASNAAGSDKLAWRIDAKRLADFSAQLSGALVAQGELSGTFAAPKAEFTAEAADLRYTDAHRVRSLAVKGSIADAATLDAARVDLQASLAGYRTEGFRAERATLKLAGTRSAHALTLTVVNRDLDALLEARGGLGAQNQWRGDIAKLESKGEIPFSLRAATTLAASPGNLELGRAAIDVGGGRIEIDQLRVTPAEINAKGRASALPLALAGTFVDGFKRQVNTTLKLGAEWNLALGGTASGSMRVFRESGDVAFRTEPALPLGLEQLDFRATLAENRVEAQLDAKGSRLGVVHATADTRLAKRGNAWGIAGDAPLKGTADLDVPSLDWAARFTGQPELQLNGRLRANLAAAGTIAKPRLTGTARGDQLALVWPAQGVNVKDGTLEARFNDDSVTIERLRVAGGAGTLEAEGTMRYDGNTSGGKVNVTLKEFEAVSRPDRLVVASGTGSVEFDDKRLVVNATLKADRGLIVLPDKSGPTMSDDIVVINGRRAAEPEEPGRKLATRIDLKLDLGRRFHIKGSGIDGDLAGVLNVVSADGGLPRALGTLRIEDGTYSVYGQKLTIERGIITFSGPIDNPGINILALRKGLAVEAGVEVRGSAISPQAKLVSTPSVPETEKLSWLILGRGLDASTQGDFSLLSAAASGLLGSGQSASLQARLANSLGVDEFGVSAPSGGQGGLLTVGKRLSSRLYLTYEQGLGHVSNLLKIRYVLSRRWSVQAQTGTDNAADVFYTLSFD